MAVGTVPNGHHSCDASWHVKVEVARAVADHRGIEVGLDVHFKDKNIEFIVSCRFYNFLNFKIC